MGQYYLAAFVEQCEVGTAGTEVVLRAWLSPYEFGEMAKLTEHSYAGSDVVRAAEGLLSPRGHFYKARLVWAGDYADAEPGGRNLYQVAHDATEKRLRIAPALGDEYKYIVNHSKRVFVDKARALAEPEGRGYLRHPLPLLTAEGNGRGGGDYVEGTDMQHVGTWARDVLSVETEVPDGYALLDVRFVEGA